MVLGFWNRRCINWALGKWPKGPVLNFMTLVYLSFRGYIKLFLTEACVYFFLTGCSPNSNVFDVSSDLPAMWREISHVERNPT